VFYSISDLFGMITENVLYYNVSSEEGVIFHEYQYYIGSSLYILAYFFLFIKISNSLSISHILRNFKIHLLVLSILNIYLVYVLQIIVKPRVEFKYECNVELVYNIVMVSVLSAALLNYIYRDNKKSLYLFFGSLFLIFSEVIDVAYIYISQKSLLSILGTSLALGGFYFFYQQSKLINEENEEKKYMVLD
jgi:predicted neutral ceramidase superfamily lipid hydrolase